MADNISLVLQTMIDSSKLKSEQLPKLIAQVKDQYKLKLGVDVDDKTATKYANQIFKARDGLKEIDKITFANQVSAWKRVNSAAKELYPSIDKILADLKTVDSRAGLTNLQKQFRGVKSEADALGVTGKSLTDTFGTSVKKFAEWTVSAGAFMSVIQMFRQMITNVVELDSAMTNLYKVTDETSSKYSSFLSGANKDAQQLGRTVSSLVEQTANWAKLGFNIDESADLAKISSIYANVGEVSDETAVSDIVTAMKAFNIEASSSINIIDKLNALGNQYAVSSADLGTGLSNAASALSLAGNDINQSLAMITAMSEVTQDASESGNALKILSMRLRGYDEETESYTNDVVQLTGEIANLTKTAKTPGGISIFTDDTRDTYKSTYQIMKDISGIWDDLTDKDQAQLLEKLAGKQRGNSIAALLTNMSQAENALSDSINSSGSAYAEQERWMDSIEAKTKQFESAFQSLSSTIVDSDLIKILVDIGTIGVNSIDGIVRSLGSLGTIGAIGGGILGTKGMGIFSTQNNELTIFKKTLDDIKRDFASGQGISSIFNSSLSQKDVDSIGQYTSLLKQGVPTGQAWSQTMTSCSVAAKQNVLQNKNNIVALEQMTVAQNASTSASKAGAIALKGLSIAGNMIAFLAVVKGIELVANAIDDQVHKAEILKEQVDNLMSSYKTAITTANDNAMAIESLIPDYERLSDGVDGLGQNVSLTTDEYSKYNDIVNEIADKFPELVTGYDGQGNAILSLKGNIELLRDAYREAQKEAYNLLITSGQNSDGSDIIADFQNGVRDESFFEKSSSYLGNTSTTGAIDALQKLLNATTGSVEDFKTLYDELYDLYGDDFNKIGNAIDTSNWSNWSEKDIQNMASTIKSNIQTLQAGLNSSLSNVQSLANAYLMTNDDYEKLDEQSKNAASIIVNGINEGIAGGFDSKEDVGAYVQNILNVIKSNPEAKRAMIGLFTLNYSDMPVDEASAAINQYIDYIAKILGEDPVTLKIRLGFDDFDNLKNEYDNAISTAKDKFGQDETSFFKTNSINTTDEINSWNKIAESASNATEAEKLYLEQGKRITPLDFTTLFSSLPTDKIEEYVSLLESDALTSNNISAFSELNDIMTQTGTSAEDSIKAIKDFADGFTISTDLISNIQDAYDLLQNVAKQYKETGLIGLSSLESIAKQYPLMRTAVNEYTQGLISADDVMSQLHTAYDNDAVAFRSAMAYKLAGNENFFSTIVNNNQALFSDLGKTYGLDVENWKTMAQAKAEIDQKLIKSLSSAWSKYYNIVFDSASGMASFAGQDLGHGSSHGSTMSVEQQKAWSEATNQVNKYNQIINKLNEAATIEVEMPDFGGIGSIGKSGGSGKDKTKKEYKEFFDWIATSIDRSDEKMDSLQDKISDTSNWKPKNVLTNTTIDEMSNKLTALQLQADAYQKKADSYDLSPSYIDKIKNGTLEIETITDEVIGNNIKDYQNWYNKAEDVRKKIDETKKSMRELAKSRLDNIINDFDSLVSLMDKYSSYSENLISLQKELGEDVSSTDYENLIDQQEAIYNQLQSKYNNLSSELSKAVSSGTIKIGTEEWRKYQEELVSVNSEMNEAVSSMNDFRKAMIDLPFEELERISDATGRANDEISTMLELIGNDGLVDGGGKTSKGLTRLALLGKQLSNAKQQTADYAEAIGAVNEMYENGSLTQSEYNEKISEYTSAQQSAVKATKEAQDAILQFRYDAIQAEIDDYKELIAKKKEAIQQDKTYSDYLEQLSEKQKEISNIQKKLNEYALSDGTDRVAAEQSIRLKEDLAKANKELSDIQADYDYNKTLESLDKQAEEYEKSKNNELDTLKNNTDAQEKVINDYLSDVQKDYRIVYNTLTQYGADYGLKMTDELTSPWDSAKSAMDTFQSAVGDAISQINIDIASIDLSKLTEMVSTMSGFSANGSGSSFEDVTGSGSWRKTSKGWWYGSSNDDYVSDGVYTIGGKQYNFNEDGYMKSGWDDSTGQWRYFEPENGQMVKSNWREGADGKDYYLKSDGTMATDMAIKSKSENGYYYVGDDGAQEGGLLSRDDIKQRKLTVGYKNGTKDSKPGLKYVNEEGPELIVTGDGTVLNSVGHDTIFSKEMLDTLWSMGRDPGKYMLANMPTYDSSKLGGVNRSDSFSIDIDFNIQGNADEDALSKCRDIIKTEVPKIIREQKKQR